MERFEEESKSLIAAVVDSEIEATTCSYLLKWADDFHLVFGFRSDFLTVRTVRSLKSGLMLPEALKSCRTQATPPSILLTFLFLSGLLVLFVFCSVQNILRKIANQEFLYAVICGFC